MRELQRRGITAFSYDLSPDSVRANDGFFGSTLDIDGLVQGLEGVDVVFHLAGVLGTEELMYATQNAIRHNIEATVNVLEACRRVGVPRVFYPAKPNDWLNTYSITKRASEEFVWMYDSWFGVEARVIRWRNAYGPGQSLYPIRKAIPTMIIQGLENEPIEIYGDGSQWVDLEFVTDLMRVTVGYTIADAAPRETVESGVSHRITVRQLAELIRVLTGASAPVAELPMRLGETTLALGAPTGESAREVIDDHQISTIAQGLGNTVAAYKNVDTTERRRILGLRQKSASMDPSRLSEDAPSGYIVILGAPNDKSGILSEVSRSRVVLAAELSERWVDSKIIPTGGFGKHFNESTSPHWGYVRSELLRLGIASSRVELGVDSCNTAEDAALVLARLRKTRFAGPLVVVTSDFHVQRARFWFGRILSGYEIQFYAASADVDTSEEAELIAHEERAIAKLKSVLE